MAEKVEQKPGDDRDIEQAVVESLKSLDHHDRLTVLEFSRKLEKREGHPNAGAIKLLEEWMADESGYAEEVWPELEKALDRNRLGYRKFFE